MWKKIVLCASLFAGAAMGLAAAATWIEPKALPAAAAIGLCLIGVTLILAAPAQAAEPMPEPTTTQLPVQQQPPLRGVLVASSSGNLKAYEGPTDPTPLSS
jgi:hypothetical protein